MCFKMTPKRLYNVILEYISYGMHAFHTYTAGKTATINHCFLRTHPKHTHTNNRQKKSRAPNTNLLNIIKIASWSIVMKKMKMKIREVKMRSQWLSSSIQPSHMHTTHANATETMSFYKFHMKIVPNFWIRSDQFSQVRFGSIWQWQVNVFAFTKCENIVYMYDVRIIML